MDTFSLGLTMSTIEPQEIHSDLVLIIVLVTRDMHLRS